MQILGESATTAANGASELVCPGVNGFIQQDAQSYQELSGLLCDCLLGDLLAMGLAARARVTELTRENNMRQMLDVIHRWTEAAK